MTILPTPLWRSARSCPITPSSCSSTEKVGSQLAMEAPLKWSSQFLCLRNLPCTPSPSSSSLSCPPRLLPVRSSALREKRHVGQTVSCSSHSRRHPLREGDVSVYEYWVSVYESTHIWNMCLQGSLLAAHILSQQIAHTSSLPLSSSWGTWTNLEGRGNFYHSLNISIYRQ